MISITKNLKNKNNAKDIYYKLCYMIDPYKLITLHQPFTDHKK